MDAEQQGPPEADVTIVLEGASEWVAARPLLSRRALRSSARDALRNLYDDLDGEVLDLDAID